ncbi:pseudouridine synthase [Leptolyngbya sp. AN02str]|uniref:RluA family pseudouridine synthase n=1 Tax=Leptolyngbya sp. AN02str TaxID=3423363 RepID=UPI003D3157F6
MSFFPVSQFLPDADAALLLPATYWYEGTCPKTGQRLRLPRTPQIEAIAHRWMQQLEQNPLHQREGKMYGVLLVRTEAGELGVLRAFSGLLDGCDRLEGWVPPIPGRDRVAMEEARTLTQLNAIQQELIALKTLPERQTLETLSQQFEQSIQQLLEQHRQRKRERDQQRAEFASEIDEAVRAIALAELIRQSQQDGIEHRNLKRERDAALAPLWHTIAQADERIRALKQRRKVLSRQLQAQMHHHYHLTNFAGESRSLQELVQGGIPTGTGDCCAPKLLHYAATHRFSPLAMAEFWYGPPLADKVSGQFYGACAERCQPLMGFLLSGLTRAFAAEPVPDWQVPIVYEDTWMIVVDKPSGLLSVPGRSHHQQNVLAHLQAGLPHRDRLLPVHRLDQDTSGLLVLARDMETYRALSQQFQQRTVHKGYEAVLAGVLTAESGVVELPLWADPHNRPYQTVDWQRGKPSITKYRVLAIAEGHTRIELYPLTGRTHQLRVHASHPQGLGIPILGDRLYGSSADSAPIRLHLHARELHLQHPHTYQQLHLHAPVLF